MKNPPTGARPHSGLWVRVPLGVVLLGSLLLALSGGCSGSKSVVPPSSSGTLDWDGANWDEADWG